MVEAAAKAGRHVQMGNQRRSSARMIEAIQRLREGAIGEVRYARCVDLLADTYAGLADGSYERRVARWRNGDVGRDGWLRQRSDARVDVLAEWRSGSRQCHRRGKSAYLCPRREQHLHRGI